MNKIPLITISILSIVVVSLICLILFQPKCRYSGLLCIDAFEYDIEIIGHDNQVYNDCNIEITVVADNLIVVCKNGEVVITYNNITQMED